MQSLSDSTPTIDRSPGVRAGPPRAGPGVHQQTQTATLAVHSRSARGSRRSGGVVLVSHSLSSSSPAFMYRIVVCTFAWFNRLLAIGNGTPARSRFVAQL